MWRSSARAMRVKVRFVSHPLAKGTLAGLVDKTGDWRSELDWVRDGVEPGIILFEAVSEGLGALQDDLRAKGFNVIKAAAPARAIGCKTTGPMRNRCWRRIGFPSGHVWEFEGPAAALVFIDERPGAICSEVQRR